MNYFTIYLNNTIPDIPEISVIDITEFAPIKEKEKILHQ